MIHLRRFLLFYILPLSSLAQPYGNEWIDFDQQYYKFPIQSEGVYRIDYGSLIASGFPLSSIDPRNIQIFAKGEEIPIFIEGESDGQFDPSDYIEFYAEGNDGFADAPMYDGPQGNPYYSLINDTIHYFITWNSSTSNLRYSNETDTSFSSYTASDYVYRESVRSLNSNYYAGQTYSGGANDPRYESTEGWFDLSFSLGGGRTRSVNISGRYNAGPDALVKWKVIGLSNFASLNLDQHLRALFAGVTFDTIFEGYKVIEKSFVVPTSSLSSGAFSFFSINDLGSGAARMSISYISVYYPRDLNFTGLTGLKFDLDDASGQTKSFLPINAFSNSGQAWVLDMTNNKRVFVRSSGSDHDVLIPNAGGRKTCYIYSEGNAISVNTILPVGVNARFTNYLNQERNDAFLIISNALLNSSASQYEAYRNSTGNNALLIDVQQLYDQFIYGINKHPLAIRNFVDHIYDNWSSKPKHLFLLGKSIDPEESRKIASNYNLNLVPTYGVPSSDAMLTAGLNGTTLEPLIPTGRLSAKDNNEAIEYLDKVMEHEMNPPSKWMKNVLHFAGGTNQNESDRFTNYLAQFEEVLEDTSFGANVFTFKKTTTAPIQITLSDSITDLINQGTSLLSFFGHASSTGGFDQNIDDPSAYNNKGKYPLLVGNSCFTGDIHLPGSGSTSEKFVLIKDKGVIAFLASVDLGYEAGLRNYSLAFFNSMSAINYGGSLGEHMQYAIQEVQKTGSGFQNRSISHLMTLHGDPSLVINAFDDADFEITSSGVSTDPINVTTAVDTFELILDIFNYGKALSDSLGVEVIRVLPDLSIEAYTRIMAPVLYNGKLVLKIPLDPETGSGFNRFDISLDPSNFIPEYNEQNNFVSVNLFIRSGDLIPVMPYEYAIVPEQNVPLVSSTGYPVESVQEYELELDTSSAFSNPIETTTISSGGGVLTWNPNALRTMKDSSVYFWRTRNKNASNSIWRSSSFQYIPGKRGWSQARFDQILENEIVFLEEHDSRKSIEFGSSLKKLRIQTSSTLNLSDLGNVLYRIDTELQEYGGCSFGSAIHIAVLDSITLEPWGTPFQGQNAANDFGQLNKNGNCGKPRVHNFFIFNSNSAAQLAGLKDMLLNKIPDGNYLLAWTWVRNDFSNWDAIDPGLRSVFANLGASMVPSIANDSLPYIFFVKKGQTNTAEELLGTKTDEFIYMNVDIQNSTSSGAIVSKQIGPASKWDSLNWRGYSIGDASGDDFILDLNGKQTALADGNPVKSFTNAERRNNIGTVINASVYPYASLNLSVLDPQLQTAPQLQRWTVLYEGVPELALAANQHFHFHSDTLGEGENLELEISVKNISEYVSDSALVEFFILDKNRRRIDLPSQMKKPLSPDSSFIVSLNYNTTGLSGANTIMVDVNPDFHQPEQTRINNTLQLPFYVVEDNVNPILDVTFDGRHILDGDIVSPEPEIAIQLSDDNPFLILDDTSDFEIYLTDPSGSERRKYFNHNGSDYTMEFIPASSKKNKAKVSYNPVMEEDGRYVLRVSAKDRSDNKSGDSQYAISFEVINRSTITHLMNYPNPFSSSTRFVFVLTGSEVPDNMQIKIMTISGKIVKTIYQYEMGPINIGRNITEYAWDGRDEYGDKLANGVYLYKVTTRLNGGEIEHRSTSADSYFKQGFGKMVILR